MSLQITSTKSTPLVEFDTKNNIQRIEGISIPIDAYEFYKPITEFVTSKKDEFQNNTEFRFRLNYYNTSSSKAIFILLQKIHLLQLEKEQLKIVWEYEEDNEFMLESGQELAELLDCEFEYQKIE
jgi:hypothetical protein